ncbi:MAG: acyltransferase [Parabacteroides sp.]|nr:acyltransferase [Parabacteroides sp.]
MRLLQSIQGRNNEFTVILPQKKIDCLTSESGKISEIVSQASLSITGNNNRITLRFDSEEHVEEVLLGGGFHLIVKGDNNVVTIGNLILRHSAMLGMTGLKLIIGQLPGLGAGVSRKADNCRVDIGDRVVINGATLYLQEDNSSVSIGDDSQLSWGIDVWCTDAHTITDLDGNPLNFAHSIEIGKHVWIGKDAKIGKNVKISDNSIVGWGSIVTRKFDEPNVILAGVPAKVVKRGINWDRKCINKYIIG